MKFYKRISIIFLIIAVCFVGCNTKTDKNINGITDSLGNTFVLGKDSKVVSCYGSFAEMWLLSGGSLVGVTEDAISDHKIDVGENIEIVGTVKNISLEKIVSLKPDYVMLSADIAVHLSLKENLEALKIPYGYFRVDVFSDYKAIMRQFCDINKRHDLYQINVTEVENKINIIKEKIPESNKKVLLMRVFSNGIKAKTDDSLAGVILKEFGLKNIADTNKILLEDLSAEHIIKENPDYIFILTMGNEISAKQFLNNDFLNNAALNNLAAIKNNNYYILPKELFHFKPNNRWGESYEYLAKVIYPELFGETN